MTVPALSKAKAVSPSAGTSFYAATKVPFLQVGDETIPATLAKLGFKEIRKEVFEHGDGSWVRLNAANNRYERGVGNAIFHGVPQTPDQYPAVRFSGMEHGILHVAYLPAFDPTDHAGAARALKKAGFTETTPGFFLHKDESWVSIADGKFHAGYGNDRLTHVPAPGTGKKPVAPKLSGKFPRYSKLPHESDWDQWRKKFAIGKLPRAEGQFTEPQLHKVLKTLGFKHTGGRNWAHPDGSKVATDGQGCIQQTSFQRWSFGDLPYEVGAHNTQWAADTQAWAEWVQSGGQKPIF